MRICLESSIGNGSNATTLFDDNGSGGLARWAARLRVFPAGRTMMIRLPGLLLLLLATTSAPARAAGPAVRWDFGQEETTLLVAHGTVHRDVPGPRPPEFPDF